MDVREGRTWSLNMTTDDFRSSQKRFFLFTVSQPVSDKHREARGERVQHRREVEGGAPHAKHRIVFWGAGRTDRDGQRQAEAGRDRDRQRQTK